MRTLLLFALTLQVAAQQPESPVPAKETSIGGSVDVGYRWLTDVAGSFDSYRSVVNLGAGPKLLGADFTIADPKHRAFDKAAVQAHSWGGDPYSTFHLDIDKAKRYSFRADYRNIAYFNALPSYADPLLSRGIVLSEQSFDTRRRFASFSLDLLPGNWLVPYFAYDRDAGSGRGVTAFVSDSNEYAVPDRAHDRTNLYRGGARVELARFHATLEQGGSSFSSDQNIFQSAGSVNYGNMNRPVLGQTLTLTSLLADYGIQGSSVYSKALFTASATPWLDVYGQFLFSQPESDAHYRQDAAGNFYLQSAAFFYTTQQYMLSAAAKLPHTTASLGVEIRPLRRLRILEAWLTDRLHGAGSVADSPLASAFAANYSQQEIDAIIDVTSKLTLRGGHRYVWGTARDATFPESGLAPSERGALRRHVGLGAMTYRPSTKLSMTVDGEAASSGGAYFRNSLYDYRKLRAQGRFSLTASMNLSGSFTLLKNHNPVPGVNYGYTARQASLSAFWTPAGGKIGSVEATYSRSTVHSAITYLAPQDLTSQRSVFREDAHTATGLFHFNTRLRSTIAAGGAFFLSSGSRPTRYFQPLATVRLPVGKHVEYFAEWRYYGYGEAFYMYEAFRAHLVTTGLRLTR